MLKNVIGFLFVAALFVACGGDKSAPTAVNEATGEQFFGEKISADGAISLAALNKELSQSDTVKTKLVGKVESVCKKKGCWMNIVSDEAGAEPIFVKFKDYGFFMPLDCEGQKVVMDGIAYKEVTPVDELRHYAEDEGKSAEEIAAITEPVEELKFMASGVIMLDKQ